MSALLLQVSKRLWLPLLLSALFIPGAVIAQEGLRKDNAQHKSAVTHRKPVAGKKSTRHHKTVHVIKHHSDNDAKLEEVKAAKSQEKK
jgi:hypothetical protein